MNATVTRCTTFGIIAHALTEETLMFAKVARRKESDALMESVSEDNLRLFLRLKPPFVEFFVSKLLHQEVHSVDFVFGDNGAFNWLVSDKVRGW